VIRPPALLLILAAPLAAPQASPLAAQEVTLVVPPGAEDLREVLESASLTLSTASAEDADAQDITAAARADYRQILTGLYSLGYYGGTISITLDGREAAGIAPLDGPSRVDQVVITVEPGPRFTFGRLEVGPLPPKTPAVPGFAAGAPAESGLISDAVASGIDAWRALGHAQARLTGEDIRAIQPDARLDVALTLDPGPRLRFGPVSVTGTDGVRPERVVEIAGLPEGRVFSPVILDRAAERLRRAGAFASVALTEGELVVEGDRLPIAIQVTEMAPRRLGFGAEFSSTEGLALSAFWLHRNLLGGAERFRVGAEVTGIDGQSGGADGNITLEFGRPATFGSDTDLTASLALTYLDEADFQSSQVEGEVGLIRYTTQDLTYQVGIGFLTAREETAFETRRYTLLTFPLSATRDRRNDPFDPTAGYYLNLDVTPFIGVTGGDSGGRIALDARYYRALGTDGRLTLAARGQIGSLLGADLLDAPADFRFYSGGGQTVRGFPYQSLGIDLTRDFGAGPAAVSIGGASYLGGQFEARLNITDAIQAVAFADVGIVGIEAFPDSDSGMQVGAGLGVRYRTPIGPIRLDLATPLSGPGADGSLQIYLGIGQAF
jgi:translocation and assembly module TamA